MKLYTTILTCLMFNISCADARDISCDGKIYRISDIEQIRTEFLNKNIASLSKNITFPIPVQLYGSTIDFYKESLEWDLDLVLSESNIDVIRSANLCGLTKFFGLIKKDSGLQITQIIFNFDKKDLRFSSSGIPSATDLETLIVNVNTVLKNQKYEQISDFFHYPFLTESGREISSEEDFKNNIEEIITSKFQRLFKMASDEKNFHHHYTGIRLNESGDIWIQYISGGLKIVILNLQQSAGSPISQPLSTVR